MDALRDAVGLFELKSKPANLPFAPLIAATRATDFEPALTASSSRKDIKAACLSLASKLDSLTQLGGLQKERVKLMRTLRWPSEALQDAFAKELRAGVGGAAGGAAAQATEALLAAGRNTIAGRVIEPIEATGVSACVKQKPLFRRIRSAYPNVSATELEP